MNLPETACIAVRGPKALLDLEGAHWGDDIIFDSTTGGLDADAGVKESTTLLKLLIQDVVVEKCGYKPREIVLFGFGQGGMVALSTAREFPPCFPIIPAAARSNLSPPKSRPARLRPRRHSRRARRHHHHRRTFA